MLRDFSSIVSSERAFYSVLLENKFYSLFEKMFGHAAASARNENCIVTQLYMLILALTQFLFFFF